jgi:hypothetical protein
MILYHQTPTENVKSILKEGLKPHKLWDSDREMYEMPLEDYPYWKAIWLTDRESELDFQEEIFIYKTSTILKVSLPRNWPIYKYDKYDTFSFYLSPIKIPPKYIKALSLKEAEEIFGIDAD